MHAGDLKQQLAVATAEAAEHNERAIQASAHVDGLQAQVHFSPCKVLTCWLDLHYCSGIMPVRHLSCLGINSLTWCTARLSTILC